MYKTKLNKIWNLIDSIKNEISLPIISDFLEWSYEKLELNFLKKSPHLVVNKGDMFFVNLWKNIWSELNKNRPCIIMSQTYHNNGNTVVVLPLKSYKWEEIKRHQILLDFASLKSKSIVDFLSIRQIDKRRLNTNIWNVWRKDLDKINDKMVKVFWLKNKE